MKLLKRTWANVDLDALEHNYKAIRAHIPDGCRFMGVMKADAYGHGAVPVSRTLAELGTEYLAVSNLEEAVQIRRGGIRVPILILGYTPPVYAENMIYLDLTQEIHSLEYAKALNDSLNGTNFILNVHLKIDTGMTRLGFQMEEDGVDQLLETAKLPHLHVEGVFTHFSVSDSKKETDVAYTKAQYQCFRETLQALDAAGIKPELRHCCNSGGTLLYPEYAMDMVRPGISLYGAPPSADAADILDLKPVMSLQTTVSQLKEIPAETAVSYGRTYVSGQARTLAVLAIGYADGLSRRLSGKAVFLIRGKEAPIVGRVCMDMCMVDVTDIPGVCVGDTAAVVSAEVLAEHMETISYEVLCGINKRIPRIYLQNGKEIEVLQYIV